MMVQVCDGQATKMEMMTRSIEQYKEVFIRAKRQFHLVVEVRITSFALTSVTHIQP